ncbi:helix-turn-helix transcriptional regulator [Serratia plymuthica]|uniref:helix-turn-helix transcriptional regulator n=1 Tax=Serratia plymuthica TaxID=82996 RepID=UPI0002F36C4E|nr:helix-turn-helix transcriptional regulator [Serratia plymuthica]
MSDAGPIYEHIPVPTGRAFTLRRDDSTHFVGLSIATHFHLMYEVMWFPAARGSFTIGNETYFIKNNTLIFIPALLCHEMQLEPQQDHLRYLLQFEVQWLQNCAINLQPEQRIQPMIGYVTQSEADRIENLLGWATEHLKQDNAEELVLSLLKTFLLFTLQKINCPASTIAAEHIDRLIELIRYIDINQEYTLATSLAAKRCDWSVSYFSRTFKSIFGQTLQDFLLTRKLTKAVRLLSSTELKISEIAEKTDFTDSAYFCAKFKKIMGCSPRNFRIRIRKTGEF